MKAPLRELESLISLLGGYRTRLADSGKFYAFDFEAVRDRVSLIEDSLLGTVGKPLLTARVKKSQSAAAKKAWVTRRRNLKAKAATKRHSNALKKVT